MTVVSLFPLLRLPRNNLKTVILNMGAIEQVCISLLSNKTKQLIRDFGTFKKIKLYIGFSGFVEFMFSDSNRNSYYCVLKNGTTSIYRGNKTPQPEAMFPVPQFDAKSWFNHFLYVLNVSKIEGLEFSADPLSPMEHTIELIKTLPPTESLFLGYARHRSLSSSQLVALRQIWTPEYQHVFLPADYSLNDLLCTSCSCIDLRDSLLTEKDINVFLKHLAAGLLPELQTFGFNSHRPNYDRSMILKGIPFEDTPADRKLRLPPGNASNYAVDIQLAEGNKATIVFKDVHKFTPILVSVD
ncbi:F-box domain-containing protein [Caenorhabditis elegans]|uniref:F-box domain-containing protein n=1 Tax=Caenorhabditis elegans TaxID=6239 RepID=O17229_CAEEL|nr:F-box domain-containing protein [Caenorhabditis elegans]CCD71286.1 F-box domain-containing protein [Caenorhabditis elegans]|eukprot:NP_493896.1 F-box B protein [Caenorhabditis elegans]